MSKSPANDANGNAPHMPGDEMVWLFLLGDMACFSLFFGMFAYYRSDALELFRESQALLDIHTGSVNTLLLLCSSWLVVLALKAVKRQLCRQAAHMLVVAAALGTGFLVLKGTEYSDKAALDIDYLSNNFWVFYYLITGMHYFHVLLGVPMLLYFAFSLYRTDKVDDTAYANMECGGIYWHMVDLLWIIIFPLIYLIP